MRMVLIASCALFVGLLGSLTTQVGAQASSNDLIKAQLRYTKWVDEAHDPVGFEFGQADFKELNGLTLSSEHAKAGFVRWDLEAEGYACAVKRTLAFVGENESSKLGVVIRVMPTSRQAKESLLLKYESTSLLPARVRFAGDFAYTFGAAALLHGVGEEATEVEDADVKSLEFVRYNVVIELTAGPKSTVRLTDLAYALDKKIKQQADEAASARRPKVMLKLAQPSVDTSSAITGQRFSVGLEFEVSGFADGTAYAKHFFCGSESSTAYDAEGRLVGDTEPKYFGTSSGLEFDDISKPAKVVIHGSGSRGKYKVGLVAWGPNLLPAIGTADLEVK